MFRSTWRGPQVAREMRAAGARGLTKWGEHVLEEARRIVPHDSGDLSRSGVATPVDPGELRVIISFDTPYAARQHEDTHLRHDDGREAKYLEKPLEASERVGLSLMATEIRRALR